MTEETVGVIRHSTLPADVEETRAQKDRKFLFEGMNRYREDVTALLAASA